MSYLSDVDIEPCDISVAGRVLAAFPDHLSEEQRVPDNLAYLGELTKDPQCAIVKLPNISAPLNQLEACIAELRAKGYDVPLYPHSPKDDKEQNIQARYNAVLGSAVNPVLRMGNSDRRVAAPVKAYAQKNPHRLGLWSKASQTHVAHMDEGDFYANEQSYTCPADMTVSVVLEPNDGAPVTLKGSLALQQDEVVDASFMSIRELTDFYEREMADAKDTELLLSLHLKATMMRVSDPIFFGTSS